MVGKRTFHLTPTVWWLNQDQREDYFPESFAQEGFIHCTDGEKLLIEVGNRYYANDPRSFIALEILLDLLSSPWKYEDEAHVYPHIYGHINREAIGEVSAVERDTTGRFLALRGQADGRPPG